ncbi:AAA domain-containing protein [Lentzea sp. BCCO 10_0856]|uniref:AAA domain-containing protein n=1 Tax=Lentzea miocenica TaxID=3095431 RepID=A0ABU4SW30_9PSEU|nr:AAA domain-containing protein [Lentzea sp. BCCO 10_0856]MDX8030123.1 AAA domain-containing protein [Lentzea sp. BCCO 10_0856]
MNVPAVLRTLARLSAAEQPQKVQLDLSKAAGLLWLGDHGPWWQAITATRDLAPITWNAPRHARAEVQHLAAFDALHQEDRLLRLGWAFLAGPAVVAGQRRRVCLPLVSRPVRLHRGTGANYAFHAAGDAGVFPLLDDWAKAAEREAALEPTEEWITETLRVAGFGDVPIVHGDPKASISGQELVVAMGVGLHAGEPVVTTQHGTALVEWASAVEVDQTAFAALYGWGERADEREEPVGSALPLSHSQERAVEHARRARITVVGGPPGSGKTHTLAALALDAVAAGKSVLLASRTRNAADVLGAALRRAGGPVPALFGDSELRQEMARELSDGLDATSEPDRLKELDRARRAAAAAVTRVERTVAAALNDELLAAEARRHQALMPAHRAVAPRAFDAGVDFVGLHGLLQPRTGFLGGLRTGWALKKARKLTGAGEVSTEDLAAAIDAAEQTAALVRAETNGTTFRELRPLLAEQDIAGRQATSSWLKEFAVSSRGSGARRAVAALAKALRSGRAARRRGLAEIDSRDLVAALPLWVGTLSDVEDILPAVPGMFDLVIIDEASHVDQPLAAPALLRGRSAVIGGDPRQLRHVSFVSDQAVQAAVDAEGTQDLRDRLDVPKVSLFDAAAATAGVHWLDEHHRCAPHLIGFAAAKFYDGKIALLTTHPAIADVDCIDTELVPGERTAKGVNQAEVDAVLAHVRKRVAAGVRSIGVVTPFRAQADALEEALLGELTLDEITTGGVRAGTVHGVQGGEFDEVVISLAADDKPGAWRFVNDRNLLAVLTTRARGQVHVITSVAEPPGLIGEYLRHAGIAPTETAEAEPDDAWTARLAQELRTAGLTVRTGYPVGQWRVDLVVGEKEDAVAVETRPHPDGARAHLARWRALTHAGWRVHDAFGSRFGHDPARAAVELAQELAPGR